MPQDNKQKTIDALIHLASLSESELIKHLLSYGCDSAIMQASGVPRSVIFKIRTGRQRIDKTQFGTILSLGRMYEKGGNK